MQTRGIVYFGRKYVGTNEGLSIQWNGSINNMLTMISTIMTFHSCLDSSSGYEHNKTLTFFTRQDKSQNPVAQEQTVRERSSV